MLTIFGAVAVTVMMVAYALERRAPAWILVFAVACAASSLYGWLARAYPFGVVESVWAVIAFRRWLTARVTPLVAIAPPPVPADTSPSNR